MQARGFTLRQDLAPRKQVFNLRTDPAVNTTTTLPGSAPTFQNPGKRSRISRLLSRSFRTQETKHVPQQYRSPLLNLPEAILHRVIRHVLDLPQKISLNFPYSPLPDDCTLHLASTPPPPILFVCKVLRRAAQSTLFTHTTFNITLLSGGPTAHFWLHHNWTGDFVGPKRCVQSVLRRAEKIEFVIAAPTVNTNIDTSTGDLDGLVRRGVEKEEWDAMRKCLAVCVAYIQGQKLGKGAVRELGKQIEKQDKSGSLEALKFGERDGWRNAVPLSSFRVVLSKRDTSAFVTSETNQVLEMLEGIQVVGQVDVELDCLGASGKDNLVFGRRTNRAESAITEEWPEREAVVARKLFTLLECKLELGVDMMQVCERLDGARTMLPSRGRGGHGAQQTQMGVGIELPSS
jgi:hypothetical protein